MNHTLDSQIHPALTSKKSRKLKFENYTYIGDNNPERVVRQRVIGSVSGNRVTFSTSPIVPNLLLSAKAWIKWTFTITKFKNEVPLADVNFETTQVGVTNGDVILMKPFMSMANATKSILLSINGKGITYNEPRYWQKYIGMLWCPENDINKYFSTAGGRFPLSTGAYKPDEPFIDDENGSDGDVNFDMSADQTFANYVDSVGVSNTATINLYEPLYVGVFNWGYDIKERLSSKYWGSKMSNLIPYVRDINYQVTLDKVAANTLLYHYGQTDGPGFESLNIFDSNIQAELVLQWVKPKEMSIAYEKPYPNIHGIGTTHLEPTQLDGSGGVAIPDSVKLQSWNLDHREFSLNDGAVINDSVPFNLSIPIIHLYQIPTYILMFATVDKDSADYFCRSMTFSDNASGNVGSSPDINSLETNPELTNIVININADRQVIDSKYSSRELYNILLKNSKKDFPFDYVKFIGGEHRRSSYPGYSCALFTPEDLNIPQTTGRLQTDLTFSAAISMTTRTGYYVKRDFCDLRYKFHLIFIYDKYYMSINNRGDVDWQYESRF